MPYSSNEGKDWLAERIWEAVRTLPSRLAGDGITRLACPRLLDIGAGAGTYADLLIKTRPVGALMPHMTAVEIHEPYVDRYGLWPKYDAVIVGDAREIELPDSDVVILGDVLEHMPLADAAAVWEKARAAATTAVFASLPIVEYPQGEVGGNPHEAHLHTWSHELVLAELAGVVEWWTGPQIGVYRATAQ